MALMESLKQWTEKAKHFFQTALKAKRGVSIRLGVLVWKDGIPPKRHASAEDGSCQKGVVKHHTWFSF